MTIFIFLMLLCYHYNQCTESTNYQQFIQEHAKLWTENYLHQFNTQNHKKLLIDIILLSYQIAEQSCSMMLAKLIAQQELVHLYTPSLTDNWHTNLQAIKNDTSQLLQSVTNFNQAQHNIEQIIETFKKIGPNIIQIDPQPTQTLINDLKQALLIWGKQQHDLTEELCLLEEEFIFATNAIADAKQMLQVLENIQEFKHSHLKQAAGYITKTNKDLEFVLSHVTQIRKTNIIKIQEFFVCFFKTYYQQLYNNLTYDEQTHLETTALGHIKIPPPDGYFKVFDILK